MLSRGTTRKPPPVSFIIWYYAKAGYKRNSLALPSIALFYQRAATPHTLLALLLHRVHHRATVLSAGSVDSRADCRRNYSQLSPFFPFSPALTCRLWNLHRSALCMHIFLGRLIGVSNDLNTSRDTLWRHNIIYICICICCRFTYKTGETPLL